MFHPLSNAIARLLEKGVKKFCSFSRYTKTYIWQGFYKCSKKGL